MATKVAVVTGANKGIGLAIVRGLCKRFEGVVYLTARDEARGKEAVAKLNKEQLKPLFHQLDVTNNKSVEVFRDYIRDKYGGIDVLVNNAAIAFKSSAPEPKAVQAEQTLLVNYFSQVATCDILFPLLRNGARVVNLSSSYGQLSNIPDKNMRNKFKDPNLTIPELSSLMQQYIEAVKEGNHVAVWGNSSYSVSKVAMTALTKIQQRLLEDRDIKVNAVHPGWVKTDMSSNSGPLSPDEGASSSLYMALDAPDSVKGQFIWSNSKIASWD